MMDTTGLMYTTARSSFQSEFMTACYSSSPSLSLSLPPSPFVCLTYFRVHDGVNVEVNKLTDPLCLVALHRIILVGKSLQSREEMKIELSARILSALPNPEAILFSLSSPSDSSLLPPLTSTKQSPTYAANSTQPLQCYNYV